MCIAILNKFGFIPEEYLFNSFSNNPDGNGLIWAENKTLHTYKTFDYNEFLSKYHEIRERVKTPIALHFRIATSGKIDLKNCHPFVINKNLAFIHNGIIPNMGNSQLSDTFIYNETRLKKLQNNFLQSRIIKETIAKEIGYSKLVFLDNNARYTIINEHFGHWHKDNWYSNNTYSYNWHEEPNEYYHFDDDYFIDYYGSELPSYYNKLTEDQKTYLFDLIDLGYDTPPDYDYFLFDYDIYTDIVEKNHETLGYNH